MSNHKIFKVEVTFDIYVLAADSVEAEELAERHAREELGNGLASYSPMECKTLAQVPKDDRNCLPYKPRKVDDERTIEEILSDKK